MTNSVYSKRVWIGDELAKCSGSIHCHFSPRINIFDVPDCFVRISDHTHGIEIHPTPRIDNKIYIKDFINKLEVIEEQIKQYKQFIIENKNIIQTIYDNEFNK